MDPNLILHNFVRKSMLRSQMDPNLILQILYD